MTIALPAQPTGADLVGAVRARAAAVGVSPSLLVERISKNPSTWLRQTAEAKRPKRETVARVLELLAAEPPAAAAVAPAPTPRERRPLNASEKLVYDRIVLAAARGEVCPSNNELCEVAGVLSVGKTSELVGSIEAKGWIHVQRGNSRRIVTVLASGLRTNGDVPAPRGPRSFARREPVDDLLSARAAPIAYREPCFLCGVRGDIGCRHQPAEQR
jgi:hypothetical protein